jgi:hypothetical protein
MHLHLTPLLARVLQIVSFACGIFWRNLARATHANGNAPRLALESGSRVSHGVL